MENSTDSLSSYKERVPPFFVTGTSRVNRIVSKYRPWLVTPTRDGTQDRLPTEDRGVGTGRREDRSTVLDKNKWVNHIPDKERNS